MRRIEGNLRLVRRIAAGGVVVVLLVVGAVVAVGQIGERMARCAEGVVKKGDNGECVGVTDGSYRFADHLTDVSKKIKVENDRVTRDDGKEEPYVSVAYMATFTITDDDSNSEESVRHELEGAYLAQYRHNRNYSPKIRLLIANAGSESKRWEHTVEELAKRQRPHDDRLVAVTGLGPSTEVNLAALNRLSEHKLAMVASTMTATNIHNIKGFVRVAPTNVDEARAASAYLKRKKIRTAVVVQDVADANLYARTLGRAFSEVFPDEDGDHRLVAESMTYDSSVRGAWQTELRLMNAQLCDQKPQVVYFAGRGQHLKQFLGSIAHRHCQQREFTVMAGDDTTNLTAKELAEAAESGVKVLYTGLAHPDMWRAEPDAVAESAAKHFHEDGLLEQWFPNDPRHDGQAIMAHDAVLTAADGIRLAAQGQKKVTGAAVGRMFHQMEGSQQVVGASGFISFRNNGDPRNKAVPILELTRNGRAEFLEVSAPRGKPPAQVP